MLKEIVEMIGGPMGGDQRNMRGSTTSMMSSDKFDGKKVSVSIEGYSEVDSYLEERAQEADVIIRHKYFSDFEITGKKGKIQLFLKSIGFKPRQIRPYFG